MNYQYIDKLPEHDKLAKLTFVSIKCLFGLINFIVLDSIGINCLSLSE